MREGQPQMDYPASKLAELAETRVMKHENPTFNLLAQDSQPRLQANGCTGPLFRKTRAFLRIFTLGFEMDDVFCGL